MSGGKGRFFLFVRAKKGLAQKNFVFLKSSVIQIIERKKMGLLVSAKFKSVGKSNPSAPMGLLGKHLGSVFIK